ncbi:MAG: hypothetical protein ACKOQ1_08665 [Actinomycetota bacterium]
MDDGCGCGCLIGVMLILTVAIVSIGFVLEIEIAEDDGTGTVFVVCRLTSDEMEPGALDVRLGAMVALTTRVRDLVRS